MWIGDAPGAWVSAGVLVLCREQAAAERVDKARTASLQVNSMGPKLQTLHRPSNRYPQATAECAREQAAFEKKDKARRASEAKLLKAASSKGAAGKGQVGSRGVSAQR